jgi:hypothetical protein
MRRLLLLLLSAFALLALGFAVATGRLTLPREYNPFAALHVADPLTPMTRFKLRRARSDAAYCAAALHTSDLRVTPLSGNAGSTDCPLRDALRIDSATPRLSSSFLASCPLALGVAMWERHALQPQAWQHFGAPAEAVSHLGSYACRSVRGGTRQSEHASANAIDITAVTIGGRSIGIQQHWNQTSAEGRFLHALHKQSCRFFPMVLGPAYDAAHHNHFHLGMGGRFGLCR